MPLTDDLATIAPPISVVIATFNRGEKIGRTLDSVVSQTLRPAEIVVVDDGSTDSTADWIEDRYPQVTVKRFPNGGTSTARNRGAASAVGDLLVFLDHDDDLHPHALETLAGLLATFPEARAAFADHTLVNLADDEYYPNHHASIPAFGRLARIPTLAAKGEARVYGRGMYDALLHGNLLQQPWAIYKSDFLALGGFDEAIRYCEDWELYLRVTMTRPVVLSDQVIASHFIEGTSNLHRAAGQNEQHMKVLRKHARREIAPDLRSVWTLRRRLALYYKANGDQHAASNRLDAWRWYMRAIRCWPFDAVVCARWILWLPALLRGRDRDRSSDGIR